MEILGQYYSDVGRWYKDENRLLLHKHKGQLHTYYRQPFEFIAYSRFICCTFKNINFYRGLNLTSCRCVPFRTKNVCCCAFDCSIASNRGLKPPIPSTMRKSFSAYFANITRIIDTTDQAARSTIFSNAPP